MAEKSERKKVHTPPFRVSFPHVFVAQKASASADAEPKYSCLMIFEKGTDISALVNAAKEVVIAKYGADLSKLPAKFKWPFRKGEEKVGMDGFTPGSIFFTASTKQPPGVIDQNKVPILKAEEFYAGCYAHATVHAYCYDNKGVGVSFGLDNLQKLRDGVPLGRTRAEDDFDVVPSDATSPAAPAVNALDELLGS